ncbi:hypothetical protein YC2023_030093 [Brassica napus]
MAKRSVGYAEARLIAGDYDKAAYDVIMMTVDARFIYRNSYISEIYQLATLLSQHAPTNISQTHLAQFHFDFLFSLFISSNSFMFILSLDQIFPENLLSLQKTRQRRISGPTRPIRETLKTKPDAAVPVNHRFESRRRSPFKPPPVNHPSIDPPEQIRANQLTPSTPQTPSNPMLSIIREHQSHGRDLIRRL